MSRKHSFNNSSRVLLLFPKFHLGEEMVSRFLKAGFQVVLFTLSAEDAAKFRDRFKNQSQAVDVFLIPQKGERFWEQLTAAEKQRLQGPDIILNFVGNELMKIRVQGEGAEWHIDHRATGQRLMGFVDSLLQQVEMKSPSLWINIVHGVGGQSGKEEIFCSTRYGVMGLTEILKMNPALKGVEVVDICLTYLRHKQNKERVFHCAHCVAEKFSEEEIKLDTPGDIAAFLIEKSRQLLTEVQRKG